MTYNCRTPARMYGGNDPLMYSAARNTLGVALLVGLAVLTWILGQPAGTGGLPAVDGGPVTTGYYLKNATLFGTDAEGRIFYRLTAGLVNRPADGGELHFEDLSVDYEPDFNVHWRLSARSGIAGDVHGMLHLSDGVRLESADTQAPDATLIEAGSLTLDAAASTASTDERVSLAHGRTRFEATGLTADLVRDRIELHSDVSARIVP